MLTQEELSLTSYEVETPLPPPTRQPVPAAQLTRRRRSWPWQLLRFGLVGCMNTTVDLLILNGLLWWLPTGNATVLLAYNSLAYAMGALNSFAWNKYWTFGQRQRATRREIGRFIVTTLLGAACNDALIWLASRILHPLAADARLWANACKVLAIFGTFLVSYLSMRFWVFVRQTQEQEQMHYPFTNADTGDTLVATQTASQALWPGREDVTALDAAIRRDEANSPFTLHGLSVVLPAHNEEQVIAQTVTDALTAVRTWAEDFEIIVVNDGSSDRTGSIVASLAATEPRIRLVSHQTNQGYGAALVSGFQAATKELTFFMDSDGQFDIRDLSLFFPYIDEYDAVIGYRIDRQDNWVRKLNAWGWKLVVALFLGVYVRDLDCAFKLVHTDFLHTYPLETRGAMINAELLYKLTREGYTFRQVGVHHYPRKAGQATGAKLNVILRAFRELLFYSRKWRREEVERDFSTRQVAQQRSQ